MKGLIVDFHGTVVGVKRLEEWVEAGLRASNSDAAPENLRLAADKLGLAPEECLMIGDTPGIDDGGVHIGMTCVIVPVGNATSPLEPITRCLQLC